MNTKRPRVICHMVTSIDGRIIVDGWPETVGRSASALYEQIHGSIEPDGWICGRVTMEAFAGGVRPDELVEAQYAGTARRDDFTAPGEHDSFAFALDTSGRLAWESNEIDGDHVVSILSERVSDQYLGDLRARGVSYILAGSDEIDLSLALERIATRFGVKTLMLEGGGRINGAMLEAGLVDELSVLIAPVADGRMGTAALFDVENADGFAPRALTLESVERHDDGVVALRYSLVRS